MGAGKIAMKHKRTKATVITKQTRIEVSLRDNGRCIICHKVVPVECSNAHFIKRSQGGMGIKENIVTLCPECHYQEDFGKNSKSYEDKIESYLKGYYGAEWDKSKLIYKKY